MTIASAKVISDINRYIDAMRETGKMPSVVHITKQQFEDLKKGQLTTPGDNWKPRIRMIPIEVIK